MLKISWRLCCKRRVFQPELYLCHRIIHVMPRPRFRNNLLYTLFLAPTASSFIWYSAGPQLNCFVTFASYLNSSKNILLLAHFKAAILSDKRENRDLVGPNLPLKMKTANLFVSNIWLKGLCLQLGVLYFWILIFTIFEYFCIVRLRNTGFCLP